jgi:hypothetical protein
LTEKKWYQNKKVMVFPSLFYLAARAWETAAKAINAAAIKAIAVARTLVRAVRAR